MQKGIFQEVQSILLSSDEARVDDMVLYLLYLDKKGYGDRLLSVLADPKYRAKNGLGGFNSISRARRKLQAEKPDLRPSAEQITIRKNLEKEYREFYKKPLCLNCE